MTLLHSILRGNDTLDALTAIYALSQYINDFDAHGMTPLMLLARRRFTNVKTARTFIKACVDVGAAVDLHTGDNRTALYYAVQAGMPMNVDVLLDFCPRLDLVVDGSYSIVHKAVLVGVHETIVLLAEAAPNRVLRMRDAVTGDTILHELIDCPHLGSTLVKLAQMGIFDAILDAPNDRKELPIQRAIKRSNRSAQLVILEIKRRIY